MIIKIKDCLTCSAPHSWIFDGFDLKEQRQVKQLAGFTGRSFGEALSEMDPDAITALLYMLHHRDEIKLRWDDVNLDPSDFEIELDEAEKELTEKMIADAEGKVTPIGNGRRNVADLSLK